MLNVPQSAGNNPLSSFMRQPKIYIRLPSNGEYWPEGSLEKSLNDEYPVYSMTAQDELLLKIPDALMNGQAVVDVIQNCMPNIKNGWEVPSIDIDVILIAIRLATYGENMKIPLALKDDVELDYSIDLRIVLDQLQRTIKWDPYVPINDELTVFVKPIDYRQASAISMQTFETQKIMQIANDESLSENDKILMFKESFQKLTKVTVGMVAACVYKVDSSAGATEDKNYIQEFINDVDRSIFEKIQNHLEKLKENNQIKNIVVPVSDDMRSSGIEGDTIEIPLTFDPSTFFV